MSVYFFNTTAGVPQNLQSVLTTGSILTTNQTINCNNFDLIIQNFANIIFESGAGNGLTLTGTNQFTFGNSNQNGIKIIGINDRIYTEYTDINANKYNNGFDFDASKDNYIIGDCNTIRTKPYIELSGTTAPSRFIDINAQDILNIKTNAIEYVETTAGSLFTTTAGSISGDHLKIKVDGVPYVIELRNP